MIINPRGSKFLKKEKYHSYIAHNPVTYYRDLWCCHTQNFEIVLEKSIT